MDIFTNAPRPAEFLLSEAAGERSRALFIIPQSQGVLVAGTLLKADGTKATAPADAAVILYAGIDATDGPVKATVVARDAEVHGELLALPEGTTDANKGLYAEALAARGIVVRWTERPVVDDKALSEASEQEPDDGA
jgi:hypothetical protein